MGHAVRPQLERRCTAGRVSWLAAAAKSCPAAQELSPVLHLDLGVPVLLYQYLAFISQRAVHVAPTPALLQLAGQTP